MRFGRLQISITMTTLNSTQMFFAKEVQIITELVWLTYLLTFMKNQYDNAIVSTWTTWWSFFVEYRRLKNAIVIYNYAWSTEADQIFIINNTISTKWV